MRDGWKGLTPEEARRESERLHRIRRGAEIVREMPTEVDTVDHDRVEDTPAGPQPEPDDARGLF